MNKLFTLLILIFSCSVLAESDLKSEYLDDLKEEKNWTVHFGGWSKHYGVEGDFNEDHKLIGIQYKNLLAGTFKNSYNDQTHFIGYATDDYHLGSVFYLSAWAGMSYGYKPEHSYLSIGNTKFTPIVVPQIKVKVQDFAVNVGVLGTNVTFVHLSYNF